jgi:regulator of sigma E protease
MYAKTFALQLWSCYPVGEEFQNIYTPNMTTLFWFLIVLTIIVFIHEFGHYIVAKKLGVKVEVFSIGFGKELFGFNDKSGTRWKFSVIPLGGYVKMFGDADPSSNTDFEKVERMSAAERQQAFYYKPLWQKALVVFAGPAFNYLSAILIFTAMFMFLGQALIAPVITKVLDETPAAAAGLLAGDTIISVDGEEVADFNEVRSHIMMNTGTPVKLVVERNGKQENISLTPEMREIKDPAGGTVQMPVIGVLADQVSYQQHGIFSAFAAGIKTSIDITRSIVIGVKQIILDERSLNELGGPIKIAKYSAHSASQGLLSILWFIALISINLGFINLLPVPMLDGGHLLFYGIEAIRGRPLSEKAQAIFIKVGIAFLFTLMSIAIFNDIKSLFY